MSDPSRALLQLTVEAARAADERARSQQELSAGMFMQYLTVDINGHVSSTPLVAEVAVFWSMPFLMRVDKRKTPRFSNPHFTVGVETANTEFVLVTCHVRDWIANDSDWVTGAKMRVTCLAPQAPRPFTFNAVAHLTFVGYAAPAEEATPA